MKALKITGLILLFIVILGFAGVLYVTKALPDTGPPQNITIERTPQRVERGRYLANHVTICMDCHSTRDWTKYAGPINPQGGFAAGGEEFNPNMGFPGTFYAPNITPYNLGKWTDGEILRAVTTGVSKNGRALFPIMGYHRFGKMDKEDIYSIIAYLRTLDPVEREIPSSKADFPVNLLLHTMPAPAAFTSIPERTDRVKYGAYLINATGCGECHSQVEKGQVIEGTEFGGGREFLMPGGVVRSANITFDPETGIGKWTPEMFISRFKNMTDSANANRPLKPKELNTPMPWVVYGGMKTDDLDAIYTYLKSLPPKNHKVQLRQPSEK
jgi:hypothetical protein